MHIANFLMVSLFRLKLTRSGGHAHLVQPILEGDVNSSSLGSKATDPRGWGDGDGRGLVSTNIGELKGYNGSTSASS